MSTIKIADKPTLDNIDTNVSNVLSRGGIKFDNNSTKPQVYNTSNNTWTPIDIGGGGGGASPTLVVVNDSGTMSGKDITVVSDNGLYSQTKPMESANYVIFELPWLGTYYIKWTLNGVIHTQTAVVDSVGGVTSTACIPRLNIINKNRTMDGRTFTVTSVSDSSETYTLTMGAVASMDVELKGLGNYTISWSDSYLGATRSETVNVSTKTGTTFEMGMAVLTVINKDRTMDGREFTVTLSSDTTKTYTFTMPAAASMEIPLAKLDTYTITWIGDLMGIEFTYSISISDISYYNFDIYYQNSYPSFSTATDEQISTMMNLHYNDEIDITQIWSIGDTRTINLSSMASTFVGETHAAQTQEFVILDFNHDDLVNNINGHTKAAVSLQLKDCLNETGYMHGSSSEIYYNTTRRKYWCNNIFYNSFPKELKSIIKYITKRSISNSSGALQTAQCYTWLISLTEITGDGITSNQSYEGTQYEYYKTASNRIKKVNGTNSGWWTRSYYGYGNNYYRYYIISTNGSTSSSNMTSNRGISPGFCI